MRPFTVQEDGSGMDDRNNTIMGWVLGAGIVALGLGSLTGHLWAGHEPATPGYAVAGEAEGGGGAAAVEPIAVRMQSAASAAGEQVFKKCAACHTITPGGANGIGPNLHGVMGEAVASGGRGYAFSDALKAVGGIWTFDAMDAWLASPRRFADGTKMSFAGLSDPMDRANLIAYLNAQGSNLPLPAAPAASPTDAAAPPAEGAAPAAVDPAAAPAAETPAAPAPKS